MNRCGNKLLITGKGRCNLTNLTSLSDFIEHIHNGRFLHHAFSQFFNNDLISFFESIGIKTITERGNRIFPASEKSDDVVNALLGWCKKKGAGIQTRTAVSGLLIKDSSIIGVMCRTSGGKYFEYRAPAVIIACGGASYPATGSTGDGYDLAQSAGHSIVPVKPALVPLVSSGKTAKRLQGLNLHNVNVSLWINCKKIREEFGEILFTNFGLSGPVILTLSRLVVDELEKNNSIEISIDLKPALSEKKLDSRLLRDLDNNGKMKFHKILKGLLPSSLIPVCTEQTCIDGEKLCHQVTSEERKKLRTWLKDFRFVITGHHSFNEAIITAGGVSVDEVNQKNMESKIIKGLFFAGEVLDIDADTGGYNLQIAFSTGWLAGNNCFKRDYKLLFQNL
jgi:predicted Rossmann fold flavoprotein